MARSTKTRGGLRRFSRAAASSRGTAAASRHLLHARNRRRRLHGHQVVDAVGDRRGVDHRIARPGADGVEIEQPTVDDAEQDPAIDAVVRRQRRRIDRVQPARTDRSHVDFRGNRRRREVLERVVVGVHAVAGGDRRMAAGELIEVVVDERGELRRGGCAARRRYAIAGDSTHTDTDRGYRQRQNACQHRRICHVSSACGSQAGVRHHSGTTLTP